MQTRFRSFSEPEPKEPLSSINRSEFRVDFPNFVDASFWSILTHKALWLYKQGSLERKACLLQKISR